MELKDQDGIDKTNIQREGIDKKISTAQEDIWIQSS
jgi:hypothetical protein